MHTIPIATVNSLSRFIFLPWLDQPTRQKSIAHAHNALQLFNTNIIPNEDLEVVDKLGTSHKQDMYSSLYKMNSFEHH